MHWPVLSRTALARLVSGGVFLLALAAGARFLVVSRATPGSGSISISNLEIGDVWAQDALNWRLHIANSTDRDLDVEKLETSCGCLKVDPPSFVLRAGASREVALSVRLRLRGAAEPLGAADQFSLAIFPVVRGEGRQGPFVLRATVRNPMRFSVADVFFSEDEDYGSPGQMPRRKVVPFEAALAIRAVDVRTQPPHVTVDATCDGTTGGTIAVVPVPSLPPGRFQCDVLVSAVTENGDRLPAMHLPVAGVVAQEVYALPAAVYLPPSPVGAEVAGSVVIGSPSHGQVSVESVRTSSKEVSAEFTRDPSAGGKAYAIRARVAARGVHSEEVEFIVTSPSGRRQRVGVPVHYIGLATEAQR